MPNSMRLHDPPIGLFVHFVHAVDEDCVRIVDVWESVAAHDAYDEPRDPPAVLTKCWCVEVSPDPNWSLVKSSAFTH